MTNIEIEKRLKTLEAEVAALKQTATTNEKPWYRHVPKFGGNPAYEEAMRLGREYRESLKDEEDLDDNP